MARIPADQNHIKRGAERFRSAFRCSFILFVIAFFALPDIYSKNHCSNEFLNHGVKSRAVVVLLIPYLFYARMEHLLASFEWKWAPIDEHLKPLADEARVGQGWHCHVHNLSYTSRYYFYYFLFFLLFIENYSHKVDTMSLLNIM